MARLVRPPYQADGAENGVRPVGRVDDAHVVPQPAVRAGLVRDHRAFRQEAGDPGRHNGRGQWRSPHQNIVGADLPFGPWNAKPGRGGALRIEVDDQGPRDEPAVLPTSMLAYRTRLVPFREPFQLTGLTIMVNYPE